MQYQFENLEIRPLASNANREDYVHAVCKDFWIANVSREVSLMCRKEVLTGKAKFGIAGDGKELPQIAQARYFQKGDYRSGYYRDQTVMMALGLCTVENAFAQLYADVANDPFSGGRQMNNHFATRFIDENDEFLDLKNRYNVSSDISSTAGQMARGLGLALTSKLLRLNPQLSTDIAHLGNGDEVVFCNIGDASTSEAIFWETINAAAVQSLPLVVSVWDDGYGISVPKRIQTTKGSISEVLRGFEIDDNNNGMYIFTVKAWDYVALVSTYEQAAKLAREEHKPVLVHVEECTQPQGHSTSGSHERYKSAERLTWEQDFDCIKKMQEWMILSGVCTETVCEEIIQDAKAFAKEGKKNAWEMYNAPIKAFKKQIKDNLKKDSTRFAEELQALEDVFQPTQKDLIKLLRKFSQSLQLKGETLPTELTALLQNVMSEGAKDYNTHLYSTSEKAAINIAPIAPIYSDTSEEKAGYEIINKFFDITFASRNDVFAFGEDVGQIGDVNQGFAGLQEKYGVERIFDAGIREWSIIGQALGMSLRGLRPIAEIQYLDYLVYALPVMTDDMATIRYRSANQQMAPAIVRTRGHRLEGIWHSGSHMALLLASLRGLYICVPRNFVQAAGMYNTLLQSSDPAVVVEPLNGYRKKEQLPDNIGEYRIPLGSPEILREGEGITVVTYGSCVPVVMDSLSTLATANIYPEVIDVQTLLPFDLEDTIIKSLAKTNRLLIVDEDIPGGASAFILQQILERQEGYYHLDAKPVTLTAKEHRPPYGDEGDYFTKPQTEDVVDAVYKMIQE